MTAARYMPSQFFCPFSLIFQADGHDNVVASMLRANSDATDMAAFWKFANLPLMALR